ILCDKGLVSDHELEEVRTRGGATAEYGHAYRVKDQLFQRAGRRFYSELDSGTEDRLGNFIHENRYWLHDYTLFTVLSGLHGGMSWNQWGNGFLQREKRKLAEISEKYEAEIRQEIWLQFEFADQWISLKKYANDRGIRVIGDIPVFVDHNSADVWAHPRYFSVNEQGDRELISGVPPDYFSETGQLWGNPLYRWKELEMDGYRWWVERFRQMFYLYDAIRVDHFRGFESYWQVPAGETTAENGTWIQGPGADFFTVIRRNLGDLPIIAEDLGIITPAVEELRDRFQFPGMKLLQFAFETDSGNIFLPHNYDTNCVVYSGTHDNDTTLGWYGSAPEKERHNMRIYTRSDGREPNWELIRLGMLSVADQAVFPLQDYMSLDSGHRMNIPGTAGNNWEWRYTPDMLGETDGTRIRDLIELANRLPAE
ncbi:MAG: 4-alpha-glucanotransferase, partial [Balneolaceae bacterium]